MALREIQLSNKFKGPGFLFRRDFYDRDIEGTLSSFTPGEWGLLKGDGQDRLLVMVNHLAQLGPKIRAITAWTQEFKNLNDWDILKLMIDRSIFKRSLFKNLEQGSRLIYGESDQLPGLVVDCYMNAVVIQINSAGIDRFRTQIKDYLQEKTSRTAILFDQPEYRKTEALPQFPTEGVLPDPIIITENQFKFELPLGVVQKLGHYYDHRVNRNKLEQAVKNYNGSLKNGLDLFCYSGAWGLSALRAGMESMTFIDQGAFKEVVLNNLKNNNLEGRGDFVRDDVFDYLEQALSQNKQYDLIISDPPAFSKNLKNKSKALIGYEKLHTSCLKLLKRNSLFAVASCTHGISHDELDRTVLEATKKSGKRVSLIDIGVQGQDHPFSHLQDASFYIKYLLYFVE